MRSSALVILLLTFCLSHGSSLEETDVIADPEFKNQGIDEVRQDPLLKSRKKSVRFNTQVEVFHETSVAKSPTKVLRQTTYDEPGFDEMSLKDWIQVFSALFIIALSCWIFYCISTVAP